MSSALGELQTPKANCPDTGETVKMQWQPELSAKSIESVVWGMNCSVDWKESGVELILTLSLSLSLSPPPRTPLPLIHTQPILPHFPPHPTLLHTSTCLMFICMDAPVLMFKFIPIQFTSWTHTFQGHPWAWGYALYFNSKMNICGDTQALEVAYDCRSGTFWVPYTQSVV